MSKKSDVCIFIQKEKGHFAKETPLVEKEEVFYFLYIYYFLSVFYFLMLGSSSPR